MCLNNIGCLQAKMGHFTQVGKYFKESILMERELLEEGTLRGSELSNLKLAIRHYNYGYSLYRQYLKRISNSNRGKNVSTTHV